MFVKKSKYKQLIKKAEAYDNICHSIRYPTDVKYVDATDKNGTVLMQFISSMTLRVVFDPIYILRQCGIEIANKESVKFELAQ